MKSLEMRLLLKLEGSEKQETASKFTLLPLTPNYDEENHHVYFDAIQAALVGPDQEKIQNIALTGGYGVGKSSILQQVVKAHRNSVVQISLSTLGLPNEEDPPNATSKTNQIQKEIVKQLLYREDPNKTPGSRFRRISRFHKGRGLFIALITALVLTMVFFLTGWTDKLADTMRPRVDVGLWIHGGILMVFTAFVYALEFLAHNRIQIQSLQAGTATITLSKESAGTTTYFDQYLDEIVYVFEETKRDIVIFEDIDRFDNPQIFENLRALNTLLNRAEQLKALNIRFIYAIKDSIFDKLGNGKDQPRLSAIDHGATRTKFFDLVVPVVPFITHRSARDLMKRLLSDIKHGISNDLIDRVSEHVTDMRLLKNIRNEFVIFREKVLNTDNGNLDLNEDSLFAMMLYKSMHLADFEKIKSRESKLDFLYSRFRSIITENITRLTSEIVEIDQAIENLDSVGARSECLGNMLVRQLERFGSQLVGHKWNTRSVTYAGRSWSDTELRSAEFWRAVTSSDPDTSLSTKLFNQPYGHEVQLNVPRADISLIVDDPLSAADWEDADREKLIRRRETIEEKIKFLSHANMHQLIQHEEYELRGGLQVALSLRRITTNTFVESRMAQLLVTEGYIDENFTLYTSIYYSERVSTLAQNFLIHNVGPNIMDMFFPLEAGDVKAILRERGDSILSERSMYNVTVLDYLLPKNNAHTERIAKALAAFGVDEQEFLTAYLPTGKHADHLVRHLAALSGQTLVFLMENPKFEQMRTKLLNEALSSINPGRRYVVNDGLREFVEQNAESMPIFTSSSMSPALTEAIVLLLVSMNARFPSLRPLGDEIRKAAVAENRYEITWENLALALNGSEDLALDQILDANKTVYTHAISRLPEYLTALGEDAQPGDAIASQKSFVKIITDISKEQNNLLPEVFALAAPECRLERIIEVPESTWTALIEAQRIPPTFENVTAYIEAQEGIDQPLADLLRTNRSIRAAEAAPEEAKEELAYTLLGAREFQGEPEIRVELVESLRLANYLEPSKIEPEDSHLAGLLIQGGHIDDSAAWLDLVKSSNWPTREFAIGKSTNIATFITPALASPHDIPALMKSTSISKEVKTTILQQIDVFLPTDDRNGLEAAALFAIENQAVIPFETVMRFAGGHANAQLVVELLKLHLSHLTEERLVPLLEALGEPYAHAAKRNGKHPKFPRTAANLALVQKLEDLSIVSSYDPNTDPIEIHMKKGG